jgi:hypothetical protein
VRACSPQAVRSLSVGPESHRRRRGVNLISDALPWVMIRKSAGRSRLRFLELHWALAASHRGSHRFVAELGRAAMDY